ncbi:hypothetical protein ABGA94_02590, partial [Stenotrophomonas sp. 3diitr2024]
APNDSLLEKVKSNMQEVRARGGELFVFADQDSNFNESEGVHVIRTPRKAGADAGRRHHAGHALAHHQVLGVLDTALRGDLSRDIARYPGEKAAMTTTVDTVKANLGRINAEIKQLA